MLVVLAAFMGAVQFGTDKMAGTDGFFHIKVARLYFERGPIFGSFPWMRHTILERDFVDHHLVLHLAQAPFTGFLPLARAAKASAACLGTLALFSFYLLLRRLDVVHAGLWSLALAGSSFPFLYRMNMPRAQALGVVLFCAFFAAWFSGRPRWIFAAVLVFTWSYQLCLLTAPMAFLLLLGAFLAGQAVPWRNGLVVLAGLVTANVVNPYLPANLEFLYMQVGIMAVNEAGLRSGTGWQPYGSWFIVESSWPTWLACFVVLTLALAARRSTVTARTVGLFMVMAMFFVLLLKSLRWMEYWPVFSMLFAASAADDLVRGRQGPAARPALPTWVTAVIVVALGGLMFVQGRRTVEDIDRCSDWTRYRGAATWLAENSDAGDLVYTTDWDDMPELFFHNHRNTYMVALDPHFMYLRDKDLYFLWDRINRGQVVGPSEFVRRSFGARFVFTDVYHRDFCKQADQDEGLSRVYADKYCSVYRVESGDRPPPPLLVEAEHLVPLHASTGKPLETLNLRETFGIACSNHQVVRYRAADTDDWLEFSFPVARTGRYQLAFHQVMAPDYGVVGCLVDGRRQGSTFDGYSPYVAIRRPILPSIFKFEAGSHYLRLFVTGRNALSRGHCVGVDAIELIEAP